MIFRIDGRLSGFSLISGLSITSELDASLISRVQYKGVASRGSFHFTTRLAQFSHWSKLGKIWTLSKLPRHSEKFSNAFADVFAASAASAAKT